MLKSAKRPLIILGKGAAYAQADEAIKNFVEKSGAPFLPMSMAKGLLPDLHPQCAGAARSTVLKDADVVMLVGARLNWLLSHGKGKTWGEAPKKFIQVDIEPREMDSNVEIAAPLVGDIGSCVTALLDAMGGSWPAPPADWLNSVKTKRDDNVAKMAPRLMNNNSPMDYHGALGVLRTIIKERPDAILVNEGANTLDLARGVIDMHQPRKRLDVGTWGVMGIGMGTAIAAAVETGKPVLAVEGDSAFGFSGMEVETICRYDLPICIVIFNNNGIYRGTDVNSAGADPATTVFVKGSRYDKMMEAFGGTGVNATSPDELKRAVNAAMDSGKPTLINAVIDPAAGSRERPHRQPQPAKRAEEEITALDKRGRSPAPFLPALAGPDTRRSKTMTKALNGVRILDFTHVQSGPTCTQLLAWFGADVIKVERPGVGDITRGQLQDIPNVDSLYFTMLNHNKRSITLDTKNPKGKEVLTALIKTCDVLVENFGPGVLDRMGFPWEKIQSINPKMIVASIKGFGPGPYEDCKVYENVAQCTGGAASTTGFRDGLPLVTGAQIGDSGTGLHLALGIVTALYQRTQTGRGQKVTAAMQDGVLNLARVKLRDQQRLAHGPLKEYSQYGEGIPFGDAVPRAGNDSGGGQPGRILKCKGWETDPNAYIYFITQAPVWEKICDVIGEPGWKTHPDYAKPPARLSRLNEIFARIEQWTMTKTKFEAMEILNKDDIPCGPILSMKELAEDQSLRATGTVVEVDHPTRGKYLSVGNPIKLSDSPSDVLRSPLLGEHTDEILRQVLGFSDHQVAEIHDSGALDPPRKQAAE